MNHRKNMKAEHSRLIPRKPTETSHPKAFNWEPWSVTKRKRFVATSYSLHDVSIGNLL